ncbi:MAG: hypothetical protein AABX59_03565 [Nanoarchaeota archaeon]
MRIERISHDYDLIVTVNLEDLETLQSGRSIGERYNGQDKLLVHMTHPFDDTLESRLKSVQQKECAKIDRETMDIEVNVPQGVLRDARIHTSNFSQKLGNLEIVPLEPQGSWSWSSAHIKLIYPSSVKIIYIY